jgi:hypothetical protein
LISTGFHVPCRIFLYDGDITYARLNAARERLGTNPRLCFTASISPSHLREQVSSVEEQVSSAAAITDIISLIHDFRSGGKPSQHLFQIYTFDEDRLSANCPIKHVSDWSFKKLLEKYEGQHI